MKLPTLDETLIDILETCTETGDCSLLFDSFSGENSYLEKLDSIFLKLGEDISNFSNDLPKTDVLVSNSLQILTELIQAYGISESLCLILARTILLLIIDEKCNVINIKRAIHVFNLLLQNPSIIGAIVTDESLEGSLQILGRKIPDIGDYECQALLFEALYRITCDENRKYWSDIWFPDATARDMFLNLDPLKFEINCRKSLNYINRNEPERRVFSVIANSVSFGSFHLKEPYGCEFWIDFNYGSQSVSFYCSELSVNEALDDSALWETILITNASVKWFFVKDKKADKIKEVTLLLNCPCHALITSSNIINPAFNSYEIILSFWGILDIYHHLEKIFGKDKYLNEAYPPPKRKISDLSEVIKIVDELCESYSQAVPLQRKVSCSVPIPVDTFENDNIIPETAENQRAAKVSQSEDIIKVISEVCNNIVSKIDTENHTSQKELSESVKESIDFETKKFFLAKNLPKKVRLYNLDRAPVYDVPPNSQHLTENIPNKNVSVTDGGFAEISADNEYNSKADEKNYSEGSRKAYVNRKRSLDDTGNDDINEISVSRKRSIDDVGKDIHKRSRDADKQMKIYDINPESEDDFEELTKRDSSQRKKKRKSGVASSTYKGISKKRKYEPGPQEYKRSTRAPREAAVKAMRVNKRILDSGTEVRCDEIEVMEESDELTPPQAPEKKRRYSKVFSSLHTDTETGSSEVSWLKQKSFPLFETPEKTYGKKNRHRKSLPVTIVSNLKSPLKKSYQQRKKKTNRNINVETGSKSKSMGFSDLENFNLTIEKSNTSHYPSMKNLEDDFRNMSSSSFNKSSNKKKSESSIEEGVQHTNMNLSDTQSKKTFEDNKISETHSENYNDYNDPLVNHDNRHEDTNEKTEFHQVSSQPEGFRKELLDFSNYISPSNEELQKTGSHSSHPNTIVTELEKSSRGSVSLLREKGTPSSENDVQPNTVFSSKTAINKDFTPTLMDLQDENNGKKLHLERFLECAVKCSQNCLDRKKPSSSKTESSIELSVHKSLSNNSASEKEREDELAVMSELSKKIKSNKNNEASVSWARQKKQRLDQKNLKKPTSKEIASANEKFFKNCSLDILSIRNPLHSKTLNEKLAKKENTITDHVGQKAKRRKISSSFEESDKHERSHKKRTQKPQKSMDLKDCTPDSFRKIPKPSSAVQRFLSRHNSFDETMKKSLDHTYDEPFECDNPYQKNTELSDDTIDNSVLSEVSVAACKEMEKDTKWFTKITAALSEDANTLTKKLLATVQKCFVEYSTKMSFLREHILKCVEKMQVPSTQDVNPHKLKRLIMSCNIARSEVERSLKSMHIMGKEYFEAEEKHYRKLRKKHVKASKKYILSMRKSEKSAIKKLEGNILLKAKHFFKKFLKHIDSA